ncbi:vomeronasal type-1 receptor 4-like [Manis pentadactyla]|uniref:vomeronasal type-1 receptor 4-like n=1 Tax=Manis pentadactyla TaxID=143292 RepID=UPI00255C48CC|nr:vomeronasal type-1 receptor 4-like [Manis pentadactyla]
MATKDRAMGMAFLLQTIVGILGNSSLFCHYIFLYYTGCKLRSTDLILKHLTVANLLVILSKGVPETVTAFGWSHFFGDGGCKLLFYVHKVSRDASVCITCLLSVLQVIMISPMDSGWAELKAKAPRNTGTSAILCWTLNLLLNATVLVYVGGDSGNKNITKKHSYGYCYTQYNKNIMESFYIALVLLRDGFCLILIIWSSGSMVFTKTAVRPISLSCSSSSENGPSPPLSGTDPGFGLAFSWIWGMTLLLEVVCPPPASLTRSSSYVLLLGACGTPLSETCLQLPTESSLCMTVQDLQLYLAATGQALQPSFPPYTQCLDKPKLLGDCSRYSSLGSRL